MLLIDRVSLREYLINEYTCKNGKHLAESTVKSYLGVMDKILNEPISTFGTIRAKGVGPAVKAFESYTVAHPNNQSLEYLAKMKTNMTI